MSDGNEFLCWSQSRGDKVIDWPRPMGAPRSDLKLAPWKFIKVYPKFGPHGFPWRTLELTTAILQAQLISRY